jgi:4-amino-4-deoxy-L-arabinose transferase-like glycosyltransferase
MPSWQRSFVIYGMLACSITGVMYLLGHQFQIRRSMLGTHSVLAAHGITAMLATLAIGSVLPFHIKAGYKSRKQLWSGFSQLGCLAILLVSGALLYYGPGEIRDFVIDMHWMLGLLFFPIFILHAFSRLRSIN